LKTILFKGTKNKFGIESIMVLFVVSAL